MFNDRYDRGSAEGPCVMMRTQGRPWASLFPPGAAQGLRASSGFLMNGPHLQKVSRGAPVLSNAPLVFLTPYNPSPIASSSPARVPLPIRPFSKDSLHSTAVITFPPPTIPLASYSVAGSDVQSSIFRPVTEALLSRGPW